MEAAIVKVKLEVKEQLELFNSVQTQLDEACIEKCSLKQQIEGKCYWFLFKDAVIHIIIGKNNPQIFRDLS